MSRSKLALNLVQRVAATEIEPNGAGDDRQRYLRWLATAQEHVEEGLVAVPVFVVVNDNGRVGVFLDEDDAQDAAKAIGVEVQKRELL